jgi:hypothetical protein
MTPMWTHFLRSPRWRVELNEQVKLIWRAGNEELSRQPARTGWQRFEDGFYSLLPLESQL